MKRQRVMSCALLSVATAASLWAAPTAAAAPPPQPSLKSSITLQVPGAVWGYGGAGIYQPRVFYGDSHINPTPVGYGYVFHWRNLSTGAAGTILDFPHRRAATRTGPGQVVVTGEYPRQPGIYAVTPSAGSFYVDP